MDKPYKQMMKALIKHGSYKKYRNKAKLIRQSKQTYYQHSFEQSKKRFQNNWQGINEILSSRKNKNGSNVSVIIADDNTINDSTKM